MRDPQVVTTDSRAAVRARFAFAALLALSFLFVQSLVIGAHATPKDKKYHLGRIKIFTSTGSYPLRIDGDAGNKTPYEHVGKTTTFEQKFDLEPGKYTVEIAFSENERWLRQFIVEAGRIYCIGLGFTEKIIPVVKTEYCKPFSQVNISAPPTYDIGGEPIRFTANVSDYSGDNDPIYTWSVSAGTIMRGQGTNEIEVETTGVPENTQITATVAVDEGSGKPLPPGSTKSCHVVANATSVAKGRIYETYSGIAFDDVKARLDNYVIGLQRDPHSIAYVIYYSGSECRRKNQRTALGELSVKYMIESRGFDRSRIKLIDGGTSSMDWVELHVLPVGAKEPQPRPDFPSSGHPDAPTVSKANRQYPCVKSPLDGPQLRLRSGY